MLNDEKIVAKLRSKGKLDDDVAAEVTALWRYGVERVRDLALRGALVEYLENETPLFFFTGPASVRGEHHPSWQNKKAGIVRNTVECCLVADRQLQGYPQFTDADCNVLEGSLDIVLVATILTDTLKYGADDLATPEGVRVVDPEHGKRAADKWRPIATRHGAPTEVIEEICEATIWHLGRWTPGWNADTRLSPYAEVTHRIDLFMSDKHLELLYDSKQRIPL